jgi:hypothetical protein
MYRLAGQLRSRVILPRLRGGAAFGSLDSKAARSPPATALSAMQCNPFLCGGVGLPRLHPRAASNQAGRGGAGSGSGAAVVAVTRDDDDDDDDGDHGAPTAAAAAAAAVAAAAAPVQDAWLPAWFRKEAAVASPGFNRYANVPGAFAVQIAIGSVYAWSMWNGPLTSTLGVVAPAAGDWGLSEVVPIFSACAVSLGVTTFTLGPWMERVGPRTAGLAGAVAYSSGLALTSVVRPRPLCFRRLISYYSLLTTLSAFFLVLLRTHSLLLYLLQSSRRSTCTTCRSPTSATACSAAWAGASATPRRSQTCSSGSPTGAAWRRGWG